MVDELQKIYDLQEKSKQEVDEKVNELEQGVKMIEEKA